VIRALLFAASTAFALAGCSGGTKPPGQPPLLDRAITAAGGDAALLSIRSVEVRARGEQESKAYQARVLRLLPARYRHELDVSDARLVQATDGTDIWATIDDYPIEVTDADKDALLLSFRLARISMLLPLKTTPELEIREEGRDDGFDTIEVRFPAQKPPMPRGPYRLFFDPATALLRRIEFEAVLFGHSSERENRIELSDYRRVEGVMIPFAERMFVGGRLVMEERVEDIRINPSIAPEAFHRPTTPSGLVIKDRESPAMMVAILEQPGPKPGAAEEAEEDLDRYLAKHRLERNGPGFRLQPLGDAELPAVGVPIAPPPPETRPTSRPTTRELPRIALFPARRIVTTVVKRNDPAERSAAIARLIAHAAVAGLEPDGPCKIVLWSADIVQLQIPVRQKKV
jgi:hypothetical protein